VSDVIAQTDPQGRDAEEVHALRRRELDEMAELDLVYDTSPEVYDKPEPAPQPAPQPAPEPKDEPEEPEQKPEDRSISIVVNTPSIENNIQPAQVMVKAPIEHRTTVEGARIVVPESISADIGAQLAPVIDELRAGRELIETQTAAEAVRERSRHEEAARRDERLMEAINKPRKDKEVEFVRQDGRLRAVVRDK
jgi:hypothetical protein